jgi:hypothetical protein
LQSCAQHIANGGVVIDDQNPAGCHRVRPIHFEAPTRERPVKNTLLKKTQITRKHTFGSQIYRVPA